MLGIEPQVTIRRSLENQNHVMFLFLQTKLNCEILDQSKGYEVRWAIAGKSIVTQLVAK